MDDEYLNEFPNSAGLDFFIQNPNQTIKDGLWLLFFFHLDMVIFIPSDYMCFLY